MGLVPARDKPACWDKYRKYHIIYSNSNDICRTTVLEVRLNIYIHNLVMGHTIYVVNSGEKYHVACLGIIS